jgi:hypothetical protein
MWNAQWFIRAVSWQVAVCREEVLALTAEGQALLTRLTELEEEQDGLRQQISAGEERLADSRAAFDLMDSQHR